jgi:RNA polymerase sigma factor (sigma-70 family)
VVAVPSKGRADAGLQRLAPEAAVTRELYEQHARKIYAFCLSRLRDPEEAEDATQSTFLNAFRGLQRGIELEHESAWLYKIAENVCLTRRRSWSRRRRVETPGDLDALQDSLPSPSFDADELLHLPRALEGMPQQQRRALLLREWQGLSYREIAEELELSQSAVETLLFRARRSLADGLSEEQPRKKGLAARLRAGGDAGSLVALLKTLFFSGGAKIVVAGAVAASSVVTASPSVRHSLEDAVVPRAHKPVHHVTPAKPVAAAPVAPAAAPAVANRAVVASPAHRAHHAAPASTFVRHDGRGHARRFEHAFVPLTPASEAPGDVAPSNHGPAAHARTPQGRGTASTEHGPASHETAQSRQPADTGQGKGRGNDGTAPGRAKQTGQPTSPQTDSSSQQQAPEQQTPVQQVSDVVTGTEQQVQGVAKGLGHTKN